MDQGVPQRLGKYEVTHVLGEGAMGVVYRAYDPALDRVLAIKVMSDVIARDPLLRGRFLREARAAGSLQHPNVVTIFDFGEADDYLFIAMEFLEGADLAELIDRGEELTLAARLDIVIDALNGLGYAHSRGVVHRDVKPANIRVGTNGHAKLMDFGIAHVDSSELTKSGEMIGTPQYMAPEQVLGTQITAQADLFSMGSVLYELLTGKRPFVGETLHSVLYAVVSVEPEPVLTLSPRLPPQLGVIMAKAHAKEPADRYESAVAMVRDLTAVRIAMSGADNTSGTAIRPSHVRHLLSAADIERLAPLAQSGLIPAPPGSPARTVGDEKVGRPATSPRLAGAAAPPGTRVASSGTLADAGITREAAPADPSVAAQSVARAGTRGALIGVGAAGLVGVAVWAALGFPGRPAASPAASPVATAVSPPAPTPPVPSASAPAETRTSSPPATPTAGHQQPVVSRAPSPAAPQRADSTPAARRPAEAPGTTAAEPTTVVATPAPVPTPAPAAPKPAEVVDAPARPVDARAEVDRVIAAYARAIESEDINELRRAYPGLTATQQRGWEGFFATVKSLHAKLAVDAVTNTATGADASVSGAYEYENRSTGRSERSPVQFQATISRVNSVWRLAAVH